MPETVNKANGNEVSRRETISEKWEFAGASGARLAARLDRPRSEPVAYALFAHCFTCSKDVFAVSRVSGALAAAGIAVLRFDFTGLGMSEGDFSHTDFSSNVADLISAAEELTRRAGAPKILIGHSLGGAAVLAAAPKLGSVRAVVTVGAPAGPAHVAHLFRESEDAIRREGEAEVELFGRTFTIRRQFLDDVAQQDLLAGVREMKKALLVFHAPRDEIVGIDNATEIFVAAKHPKSFISLDGADHLLTRKADAIYVAEVIAAWASRYVAEASAGTDASERIQPPAPGTVRVSETGRGLLQNRIEAGRHTFLMDEPAGLGGADSGPTPYDMLLAALGGCTAMTVRLYANRKRWPLEQAMVSLRHEKIHAEDCADCETRDTKIDRISRELAFIGDLSDDQRARLLEIADKCPVHRTLTGEIRIDSVLANPPDQSD